jgi:hypothetical protein
MSLDYFNMSVGAFEFYLQRWMQLKNQEYYSGLGRIRWKSYNGFHSFEKQNENHWY